MRKKLKKSTKASPRFMNLAFKKSDLTFVTVGTPSKPDGSKDLKYIESAAHDTGKASKQKNNYHITIIKNTVVPGTTQSSVKPILEKESKRLAVPMSVYA
jgi:UDPglucose 6-dehydrogenase